jgi:eukaryotic-like serine/threonine-protein kinase
LALAPGTRLGPYEIVAALGAGGMGEVYRATDTKLKRPVAIKILPRALAVDPDRLARFQREAEVLASLNHPHIATIYGLENADGLDALVMELVDGEDLARRLARGPLPTDDALAIARQIAEALEAAHERGIVHRDLKPANVMVRPDGAVKVLDFGLAKALEPQGEAPDASQSPTRTSPAMTRAGVILGTAAYMSPEQARGKTVDRRADIWAFGCVLYEMLTGRVAFRGETISDTIAAILGREPDWNALPASAPSGLRQVLTRCLEKDLKQRSRDIGDVRLQIDDAVAATLRPPDAGLSSATRWSLAALTLAVIATAVVVLPKLQRSSPVSQTSPTAGLVLTRATADDGVTADPALSKDGALLAYASDRAGRGNLDIWIQQAAGGTPIQLTRDEVDEREPAFSPDGRLIAYRSEAEGGGIYIIPSFGGQQPRLLVREGRRPRFSPDGASIAYWAGTNIGFNGVPNGYRTFVVPTTGGAPREMGVGMTGARYPVWSPDGRLLVVLGSRASAPEPTTYDWWILPLGDGAPVKTGAFEAFRQAGVLTAGGNIAADAWRDGRVLFSDFQQIWSVGLDASAGRAGDVERLTFGTTSDGQATVSENGTIAFSSVVASDHIWSLPLDTRRGSVSGAAQRLTNGSAIDARPSMSADGSLLAYNHNPPKPGTFVKNLKDGSLTELGVDASGFGPAISPDGRWVAYESKGGVSLVPSRGGSGRELCKNCTIGDWTDDSRATTVVMLDAQPMSHLTLVNIENGSTRDLTEPGAAVLNRPFLNRGSRLLAFREFVKQNTIYIGRVPAQGPIKKADWMVVVPPERDTRPCGWSPDGALLYFLSSRDGTRCLYAQRVDPSTGKPLGECIVVRHFTGARNMWAGQFGVLSTGPADAMRGGSFLYDLAEASANIWMLSAR